MQNCLEIIMNDLWTVACEPVPHAFYPHNLSLKYLSWFYPPLFSFSKMYHSQTYMQCIIMQVWLQQWYDLRHQKWQKLRLSKLFYLPLYITDLGKITNWFYYVYLCNNHTVYRSILKFRKSVSSTNAHQTLSALQVIRNEATAMYSYLGWQENFQKLFCIPWYNSVQISYCSSYFSHYKHYCRIIPLTKLFYLR